MNNRKKKMSYHRMTEEERNRISVWTQEEKGVGEIARLLGRHRSSIWRELRRNSGRRGYDASQAHRKAQERARRPGERVFTEAMREYARAGLARGWTPEAVCGRARLEGRPFAGKDTLYAWIYAAAKRGGADADLWRLLPRARRKRRRRLPRPDRRGRIKNQVMIDQRPAAAGTRLEAGHWEGDLINGCPGGGHLVTHVERMTRFTLVGAVASKEAREVSDETCRLMLGLPAPLRKTLTFDSAYPPRSPRQRVRAARRDRLALRP